MKKLIIGIIICVLSASQLMAFDMKKIANDKEIKSNFINQGHLANARKKINRIGKKKFYNSYYRSLKGALTKATEKYSQSCGLQLYKNLKIGLIQKKIHADTQSMEEYVHAIRSRNLIDDLLAEMLVDYGRLQKKFDYYNRRPAYPKQVRIRYDISDKEEIINFYKKLNSHWPDGKNACVLGVFKQLSYLVAKSFNIKPQFTKTILGALISTNLYAYNRGLISKKVWNRLEIMRYNGVLYDRLSLSNYLDNTLNAKDLLKDEIKNLRGDVSNQTASNRTKRYLSQNIYRHQQLTRRKKLYQKFNSQQVLLLANIMVKAARRMNADRSEIHIHYIEDDEQPDEIYVISPMEQYRMSLKMLRKDYANTTMSTLFNGISVDYEDIVMASLETGVIGFDELDYIVQYEYFWLPKKMTRWQKIRKFLFGFAGTASFFLPTPFNVIGAVGLVYTQTLLFKKNQEVNSSQNTNSIF